MSPGKSTGPLLQRHSLKFVKGKDLLIADDLSKSQTTSQKRSKFEHEIETTRVVHEDQSVTSSLAETAEATAHDTELQSVVHHISEGWTNNKRNDPIEILHYWSIKDELSVSGGIKNNRIVVPMALRKTLLVKLHQAHMGTESALRRARTSLWWSSMNNQLKQFIILPHVEVSNAFETKNQKETLMSYEIPNRPWFKVDSDIFEWQENIG